MLRSLVSIAIFGLLTVVANAQPPYGKSLCGGGGGGIEFWNNFGPPGSRAEYSPTWTLNRTPVLTSYSHHIRRMRQCGRGVVTEFLGGGGVYYSPNCYDIGVAGPGTRTEKKNSWETACPFEAPRRRR
jgi:hypothetical protein